jgi:hypothetical protein
LAFALALSRGFLHLAGLALVFLAISLWALGCIAARRPQEPRLLAPARWLVWLAGLVGALGLFRPPTAWHDPSAPGASRPLAVVSVLALALYLPDLLGRRPRKRWFVRGRTVLLFTAAAAIGIWLILSSPEPVSDVWGVQQQAADALLHGQSPYGGAVTVLDTHTFARWIDSYPYPPVSVLLSTASYALTGDSRWVAWLAVLLTAYLLRRLAARRVSTGDPWPDLLAAAVLFFPQWLFALYMTWAEVPLAPLLLLFALWIDRAERRKAAVALGLFAFGKQQLVLYLPFVALAAGVGWTTTALAAAIGAATLLPFLVWNASGMWTDLIVHHLNNPFRDDALSLTAIFARLGGPLPSWLGFAATLATLAATPILIAVRAMRGRLADLLLACCVAYSLFYYLGRQAFFNYYYLVAITCLVALALDPSRPESEASPRIA